MSVSPRSSRPQSVGHENESCDARGVHAAVRLGVDDVVVRAQLGHRLGDVAVLGLDELGALDAQLGDQLHAGVGAQFAAVLAVQAGLALDDDVALGGLSGRRGDERDRQRQ